MSELRAVTIDLDDTLFAQADWLAGAWKAVARTGIAFGIDPVAFHDALVEAAAEGSDRGGIIDRGLMAVGIDDPLALLTPLVAAFTGWAPGSLPLYPGVREALHSLRAAGVATAIVTDGNPSVQRSKILALGLIPLVDHVVISDELGGRAARKPDPAAFLEALRLCEVGAGVALHIGDRPAKDVVGAAGVGMRAVRVRTGEYASSPDGIGGVEPWRTAETFAEAVDHVLNELIGIREPRPSLPATATM